MAANSVESTEKQRETPMILASLALAAIVATAPASSLNNLVHLHGHTLPDTRVSLRLVNQAPSFRDVKVDGHAYTIPAGQALRIKAPVGTLIYADSRTPAFHRGDVMLEVTPSLGDQNVNMR